MRGHCVPGADTGNPCIARKPGTAQISIRTKVGKGSTQGIQLKEALSLACESVTEFLPGPRIDFLYKLGRDQLGQYRCWSFQPCKCTNTYTMYIIYWEDMVTICYIVKLRKLRQFRKTDHLPSFLRSFLPLFSFFLSDSQAYYFLCMSDIFCCC